MENKDIGLLKYCFSTAGQKKQKEAAAYLRKAAECLRKAGAISVTEENGKFRVVISTDFPPLDTQYPFRYISENFNRIL